MSLWGVLVEILFVCPSSFCPCPCHAFFWLGCTLPSYWLLVRHVIWLGTRMWVIYAHDICYIQAKALNVLAWIDSVSTNPWSSILSFKYLMPLDNGGSLYWHWRGKIPGAKQSRGSQITLGSPHMVTAYLIPLSAKAKCLFSEGTEIWGLFVSGYYKENTRRNHTSSRKWKYCARNQNLVEI